MPIPTIGSADGEPSTAEAIAPSIRSIDGGVERVEERLEGRQKTAPRTRNGWQNGWQSCLGASRAVSRNGMEAEYAGTSGTLSVRGTRRARDGLDTVVDQHIEDSAETLNSGFESDRASGARTPSWTTMGETRFRPAGSGAWAAAPCTVERVEERPDAAGAGLRTRSGFNENPGNPVLLGKSAVSGGQNGSQNAWQNAKRLAVRLAVESQTSRRMSSSRHFETVRPDDLTPRQRRGGAWRLEARIPGDHLYSVPAAPAHALAGRGQSGVRPRPHRSATTRLCLG